MLVLSKLAYKGVIERDNCWCRFRMGRSLCGEATETFAFLLE